MGILNDYEDMLIGNRKKAANGYFVFDKKGNERVALSVIKYAIEELLGWDAENAVRLFNYKYVELMKLEQMIKHIIFPSDVPHDDTNYILYLLYPKYINYDVQKYTLQVYENVLHNKSRYPKDYMYGYLGLLRAKICLQYVIQQHFIFQSTDELYKFFASKECLKTMRQYKLYQLYTNFYDTPLEYMHDSMPRTVKNEFLYHNYMFLQKFTEN